MQQNAAVLDKTLRAYFEEHRRAHLPWRRTRDPYGIFVSEAMLQQTQAERVLAYWDRFLKAFPTARVLAEAPLSEVLALWQGLGYNGRAKRLRDAARMIEEEFGGKFPRSVSDIERLPGAGPYTARAVAAFAFNKPEVFIETNIRCVFLYHFFRNTSGKISDAEILPLVAAALKRSRLAPRQFYAALMDYGSHLKKRGVRNNAQSKHYARQSKFEGSRRQLRGQILKFLLEKPLTAAGLAHQTGRCAEEVREELARLASEGLIHARARQFTISG